MKIEEAIEILDAFRIIQAKGLEDADGYVRQIRQENLEAFTMAIVALRRQMNEDKTDILQA